MNCDRPSPILSTVFVLKSLIALEVYVLSESADLIFSLRVDLRQRSFKGILLCICGFSVYSTLNTFPKTTARRKFHEQITQDTQIFQSLNIAAAL